MPRPPAAAAFAATTLGLVVTAALRPAPAQEVEKKVEVRKTMQAVPPPVAIPAPQVPAQVLMPAQRVEVFRAPAGQPGAAFVVKDWAVKAEVVTGQTVSGILAVAIVRVDCDLGDYNLDPDKVRAVHFRHKEGEQLVNQGNLGVLVEGTVTTTTGEEFRGKVYVQNWVLETDLGRLGLKADRLASLAFSGHEETSDEKAPTPKP